MICCWCGGNHESVEGVDLRTFLLSGGSTNPSEYGRDITLELGSYEHDPIPGRTQAELTEYSQQEDR